MDCTNSFVSDGKFYYHSAWGGGLSLPLGFGKTRIRIKKIIFNEVL